MSDAISNHIQSTHQQFLIRRINKLIFFYLHCLYTDPRNSLYLLQHSHSIILHCTALYCINKENYGTDLSQSFFHFMTSPRNLRSTMHWNIVLTVFHALWCVFCVWKIVRTTFWCIVVSQSRRDCSIMWKKFIYPGPSTPASFFKKTLQLSVVGMC